MSQRQIAHPCDEHADCTVIGLYAADVADLPEERQRNGGGLVQSDVVGPNGQPLLVPWKHPEYGHIIWQSHAHKDTHIACRIGDATPECTDHEGTVHSWQEMCGDCTEHFTS